MVCSSCPRKCGVDRSVSKGFCNMGESFVVSRAAKHMWEEPCISGKNGSGTVFFSGCNLKCVFCQNYKISHECFGKEISEKRLCEIFDELIESGAHNINLVNPSHYADKLADVLKSYNSPVPIVYNTGSYDSVEALKRLEGLVDIYLPDLKCISKEKGRLYFGASDYFSVASKAIAEMKRQVPDDEFDDDGMMKKGVIIRHLVLPKNTNPAVQILDYIKETFGEKTIISLMLQYTPYGDIERFPELQRKITKREYEKVLQHAEDLGFENAYIQLPGAADEKFIPPFDLSGV